MSPVSYSTFLTVNNMDWFVKNLVFSALAVIIVQLIISEAGPLSEDLMDVNSNALEQHQMKFREKCLRASGSDEDFQNLQVVRQNVTECVKNIYYNASAVQADLYDAQEDGKLDEVIRKYCNKNDDLAECFTPLSKGFEKCMESEEEKKFVRVFMDFLKSTLEYVCYNNGKHTKALMERGGLDCIEEKLIEIQHCFLQTTSLRTAFQAAHENAFLFDEAKCSDIPSYESCVVDKLRNCSTTSAVEFHDGLFRSVKKILPCDFTKNQTEV